MTGRDSLLSHFTLAIIILWINTKGSWSVTLHDILGPSEVVNNSRPYVVLDCDFSINVSEREGMILKWYLNGKTIYQWIPPSRPQGLGALRGKINLDYDVSPDPWKRHRGLYIHSPSIEMSGDYTCKISTLQNEVSKTKRMVVYVPPRRIQVVYTKAKQSSSVGPGSHVNVTCMADHVYPEPQMKLYLGTGSQRKPVMDIEERVAQYARDRAWQKILFVVIPDRSLKPHNVFECQLVIPGTNFEDTAKTVYSPKNPTVMASASGTTSCPKLDFKNLQAMWLLSLIVWKSLGYDFPHFVASSIKSLSNSVRLNLSTS